MTLTTDTPITIQWPESDIPEQTTTWGEFAADNDDADLLDDIAAQIAESNYAEIGGGAAPLTWIFA